MAQPASTAVEGQTTTPDRPDVFVSYAREDTPFVRDRLAASLQARGKKVWLDLADIPPATDWEERIHDGIEAARAFLFVLSPDSVPSEECRKELSLAVGGNKRVIPILRREVEHGELAEELRRPNWIFLRDEDDFDNELERLIEAIDVDRTWIDLHARLAVRAREWSRAGDDRSLLLRGSDLRAAERWLADQGEHAEPATPGQSRYIVASRQAATRRQRLTLAAVLLALGVSVGLGILAVIQRNEAQEQRDRALSLVLAAGSVDNLATDPELSLLLALQAVDRSRTTPAREALRQAVGAARWRTVIRPRGGQLVASDLGGDGRFVVTADGRKAVTLWDARTGRPVRELRGHRAPVRSAELSPDGRRVATAAADGSVRVWDARSGALLGEVPGADDRVAADDFEPLADFSPDGNLVYAAGKRVTRLWDVRARRVVAELPVPGEPFDVDVDISPDGRRVATTRSLEDATQIWDVATGRLERTLRAPISMARFSPDGRRIATGGGIGGPARLWDVRTGKRLATLRPRPGIEVDPVAFSPDGRKVVGVFLSDAYVFDARTGRAIARLRGHSDFVSSAVFSPDSRRVLTASQDGTARIWDAATGRSLRVLRGHTRAVAAAVYTRDASTIATLAEDGTTRVWDADSGVLEFGTDRGASYASFTPDGRAVVDGVEGTAIPVWDARTGRELAVLTAAGQELGGAVTSPAGNLVGTSLDDRVALWSTRTWRRARTLEPLDDSVRSLAFSRDGRRVVASSYGGLVRVSDTATGRPVAETVVPEVEDVELIGDGAEVVVVWDETRTVEGTTYLYGRVGSWDTRTGRRRLWYRHPRGSLSELDLSRDGRRLVASGPEQAVVFDVSARRRLVTIEEPDTASGLLAKAELSPDGARLVTANSDNVARLWDARTGRRLRELRGHTGSVTDAGFSSDGRYVATIAEDGTGRIWDSSTGATVEVYKHSPDASLPTIQFAPKDERVLTADGTAARIVRCRLCAPLEPQLRLARRLVARSLSPEERRAYGLPADG